MGHIRHTWATLCVLCSHGTEAKYCTERKIYSKQRNVFFFFEEMHMKENFIVVNKYVFTSNKYFVSSKE